MSEEIKRIITAACRLVDAETDVKAPRHRTTEALRELIDAVRVAREVSK